MEEVDSAKMPPKGESSSGTSKGRINYKVGFTDNTDKNFVKKMDKTNTEIRNLAEDSKKKGYDVFSNLNMMVRTDDDLQNLRAEAVNQHNKNK